MGLKCFDIPGFDKVYMQRHIAFGINLRLLLHNLYLPVLSKILDIKNESGVSDKTVKAFRRDIVLFSLHCMLPEPCLNRIQKVSIIKWLGEVIIRTKVHPLPDIRFL